MCGIASIISSDPARRVLIDRMVNDQRLRGPDNSAVWEDARCAMGHNRLSLQDLTEAGDQPMRLGDLTLVYNGEIYNHQALRAQHLAGEPIASTSDTATLLHLIAKYGVRNTLPLLRGMYAFAVWDAHAGVLVAAVDPFGVKPMYVYHNGSEFALASSSAALLNLKDTWTISAAGMARFFQLGGTDGVWKGIQRVRGGTLMQFDAVTSSLHSERRYTPTFNPNAEAELPGLLDEALQLVQVADVSVGLFLSGGVDSSLAASTCAAGAPAFHLQSDEAEHAAIVADHFGMPLHVVEGDPAEIPAAYADIALHTGEPTMGGHIPWLVSRYAADHCKAAISANGADELFFGYDRTARSPQDWRAMERHILRDADHYTASFGRAPWINYPITDLRFPYCAHTRWFELMTYIQHDLNPTLDAASMCHSLELRVPYLDHKLVEAALSLPHTWHGNKRLLRERLAALGIPDGTINRRKLGFSLAGVGADHARNVAKAVKRMHTTYGLRISPNASSRDRAYLELCCLSWTTWEDTWKHKLKNTLPA